MLIQFKKNSGLFLIALCLIWNACSNPEIPADGRSLTIPSVEIKDQKDTIPVRESTFMVEKFNYLVDSLLKRIANAKITLSYSVHALTSDSLGTCSWFQPLLMEGKVRCLYYRFDPGKGNRAFRIWLAEAVLEDSATASRAFTKLVANSKDDVVNGDHFPGLTYTNDFVVKNERTIYWLNSPCVYAFFNHQKLKNVFLECIDLNNLSDSIHCRCGAVKCQVFEGKRIP